MFRHILVPTDGSELSMKAIPGAVQLARQLGARITGYVCLEEYPYTPMSEFVLETPADFGARIEKQAEAWLKDIEQAASAAQVPFAGDTSQATSPATGIIEAAQRLGCDMIFMASHGRSGIASLILGSETQKVLSQTTIPVLVFR